MCVWLLAKNKGAIFYIICIHLQSDYNQWTIIFTLDLALKIDSKRGLLTPITYHPSPHCDDRPTGSVIDMVVVHGISLPAGQFGSDDVRAFFCGELDFSAHPDFASIAHLKVSSHLYIRRVGGIIQFVPFERRAWHA